MPSYDYGCPKCGRIVESVIHTIAELEKPSEETIEEITCHCESEGVRMKQIFISAPGIKTPTRDRLLHIDRKKRNKNHFNKEVLPTLGRDERIHHLKKSGKKVNTKKMGLVG